MKQNEEKARKGHSDLYRVISKMEHVIGAQHARHPRTRLWKDLLKMVEELREIQADWFDEVGIRTRAVRRK